jgi:hypothetical protein
MATIERQLQLEGRLVKILLTLLLLSWIAGLLGVSRIVELREQRDAARARAAAALWLAEDQRLAVRACYARRMDAWEKSVAHLASDE